MPSLTFAYLRVSKLDQDLEEKISGKISWRRRQIATILESAQEGDTIIVSELSRLGRSMLECMEILSLAM